MESLYNISQRRVQTTPTAFHRYLYDQIDWRNRMIAIKGARGTGKSTMMLQYMKEHFLGGREAVYISLDNLFFTTTPLIDFVDYFYVQGGKHLFIDEVHKYPLWQSAMKNIYDSYPDMQIVYSGSSMLQIDSRQGDLSRRQMVYELNGLSFREFLEFEEVGKFPVLPLEELLKDHVALAMDVTEKIKVIPLFQRYLKEGYYPFYKETPSGYDVRLMEMCRMVIESDMPSVEDVTYTTIEKTKRMLMVIAANAPQTPKLSDLCEVLETSRDNGLKMLMTLHRAALIRNLHYALTNFKAVARPDKILMNNPNLMYALAREANIGSVRESFFCNQVANVAKLILDRKGDFRIDDRYVIEVGGKNKSFSQIADLPDSYLAVDDTEIGFGARIPLWEFGFLY